MVESGGLFSFHPPGLPGLFFRFVVARSRSWSRESVCIEYIRITRQLEVWRKKEKWRQQAKARNLIHEWETDQWKRGPAWWAIFKMDTPEHTTHTALCKNHRCLCKDGDVEVTHSQTRPISTYGT